MKQPKVLRWLRSRPLARVRRNLATQKRIRSLILDGAGFQRARLKALAPEEGHYRPTRNQRELFASKEDWKLP